MTTTTYHGHPTLSSLNPLRRWVCYSGKPLEDGKIDKQPLNPLNGKAASVTDPATWGTRAEAEAYARTLRTPGWKPGIGIVLGPLDDDVSICGVDFDGCLKDGVLEPWAEAIAFTLDAYSEVSPRGGGAKVLFRVTTADLAAFREATGIGAKKEWEKGKHYGIELHLSASYYTVTGDAYGASATLGDILPIVPLASLLAVAKAADQWLGKGKTKSKASTGGDNPGRPFHVVRDALMHIPNDGSNPDVESRQQWVEIGMALHHASAGSAEGLEAWHEWSARWPRYDQAATTTAWESFRRPKGRMRTGQHILNLARKYGWHDLDHLFGLFDEIEPEGGYPTDDEPDSSEEDIFDKATKAEPETGGLTFSTPSEWSADSQRKKVIKGLLAEGELGCIVAAPNVGKSLLAPRIAFAVAQGKPVFGMRVRQGGVLYVAAEDESGMRDRIEALRREHGEADDFLLVGGVSDLLSKTSPHPKALVAAVKTRRPALVIIDTVSQAFPGLEENTAEGMGRVVAVAKSLTKWGAAVILIHHDTKDGQQGLPRGHSLLNGALDMCLLLTDGGDGIIRGKLTKVRNGSRDRDIAFTVGVETLGLDEDGDPITVGVCHELDPGSAPKREDHLADGAKAALRILADLIEAEGVEINRRRGVPKDRWREVCIASGVLSSADERGGHKRAFNRALKTLREKRRVEFADDYYFLAAKGGEESFSDSSDEDDFS